MLVLLGLQSLLDVLLLFEEVLYVQNILQFLPILELEPKQFMPALLESLELFLLGLEELCCLLIKQLDLLSKTLAS